MVDPAIPDYPVTAHVYGSDISLDNATQTYSATFHPGEYGLVAGTQLEVEVYMNGTLVGTATVDLS